MGVSYAEMLDLTWREYDYLSVGYERRMERGWDYVRHLIASNFNSSGFSKKAVKAKEVITLPLLDRPRKMEKVPKEKVLWLLRG
jgi:hypothetical protein